MSSSLLTAPSTIAGDAEPLEASNAYVGPPEDQQAFIDATLDLLRGPVDLYQLQRHLHGRGVRHAAVRNRSTSVLHPRVLRTIAVAETVNEPSACRLLRARTLCLTAAKPKGWLAAHGQFEQTLHELGLKAINDVLETLPLTRLTGWRVREERYKRLRDLLTDYPPEDMFLWPQGMFLRG